MKDFYLLNQIVKLFENGNKPNNLAQDDYKASIHGHISSLRKLANQNEYLKIIVNKYKHWPDYSLVYASVRVY